MEKLIDKIIEWFPLLVLAIFLAWMGAIVMMSLSDSLQREAESGIMKKELIIRKEVIIKTSEEAKRCIEMGGNFLAYQDKGEEYKQICKINKTIEM